MLVRKIIKKTDGNTVEKEQEFLSHNQGWGARPYAGLGLLKV